MKPHHATVDPINLDEDMLAEFGRPEQAAGRDRKMPEPMGVNDLLSVEEPDEEWLAEGFLPAGGNVLAAGYPKTYKTMWVLELAVALASGTDFLGRFPVPERRRVGIVLMEDQAHRVRWRLQRLCQGRGITLSSLEGWLHMWFRPPLRLSDETSTELAEYAAELDLDVLWVDSWAYVATGDSNSSDDVTPQLQALSHARVRRPGLTVGLTHHARKDHAGRDVGTRLTDEIRNSGAFGAWYDAGIVLARRDETSPVTVRAELRDFAAPESFAFTVKDEDPAGPHNGHRSTGWLRLQVSDHRPELLERFAAAEKLLPAVREYLAANPDGVSRRQLRDITGRNADIEAAFDLLKKAGEAEYIAPEKKGGSATYRLLPEGCAPPCPDCAPGTGGEGCARCAPTPVGGGHGHTPRSTEGETDTGTGRVCECGASIGPTAEQCATCKYGEAS